MQVAAMAGSSVYSFNEKSDTILIWFHLRFWYSEKLKITKGHNLILPLLYGYAVYHMDDQCRPDHLATDSHITYMICVDPDQPDQ
jgi:hypothetical protein